MSIIGQYASLEVVNVLSFGFYLNTDELGEVLLPKKQAKREHEIGDLVDVFIYLDSEDRPVATENKPYTTVGGFAYLEVTDSGRFGAFMNWGLDKEVLVPFAEQHKPLEVGQSYIAHLYLDAVDNRITASTKIDKFVEEDGKDLFKPRQAVTVLIANSTDLGYKAIVNNSHWGVIYKSDVHQRLSFGQKKSAFIKRVRPDGKIDLTFDGGQQTRDKNSETILNYLNDNNGFAPFHDKSDPKMISRVFKMSKGAFKKAIGGLYKNNEIVIEKSGIKLTTKK